MPGSKTDWLDIWIAELMRDGMDGWLIARIDGLMAG